MTLTWVSSYREEVHIQSELIGHRELTGQFACKLFCVEALPLDIRKQSKLSEEMLYMEEDTIPSNDDVSIMLKRLI